ncbi:MAG: hypothetical protein HY673_12145 [Chloroflexi bacterium]|nr:hypothetical protein [Chloroflexota bacterium]
MNFIVVAMPPIPFRDANELEELGAAGFLKIENHGGGYQGALFLVNARGEPLEFTYTRVETPSTFLWRRGDVERHALRKLTASLLSSCPRIPSLILCLANEVGTELFCEDIQVSLPVCRLAPQSVAAAYGERESRVAASEPEPLNLFWFPGAPSSDSPAGKLFERIVSVGLLLEPFDRASTGLAEVFNESRKNTPA